MKNPNNYIISKAEAKSCDLAKSAMVGVGSRLPRNQSDELPESRPICQHQHRYVQGCARFCNALQAFARICKHFQASAKFCKLVQGCSTGAMRAAQYIKTSTNTCRGARLGKDLLACVML